MGNLSGNYVIAVSKIEVFWAELSRGKTATVLATAPTALFRSVVLLYQVLDPQGIHIQCTRNRAQSIIAKTYLNRHHLRATTCIGLEAGHAASSQGPPGRCCGVNKCSRVLFFAPRLSLSYHSLPSLILALVQLEGLIYDGVTDPPVFIISNFMWNVEHFPIYVLSMASLPSSSI